MVPPPPPTSKEQVEVLTSLLNSKGLDAEDLLDAIQMLAAAKKAAGKVPGPDQDEMGRKVFQEKEFLYPGLTDAWIYRNGQTKSRSWYLRVKTPGQPPFVKGLGRDVNSREQAIVAGQMLYQEVKGKVQRGERRVSLITGELIKKYLDNESKHLTEIPKAGIVPETFAQKKNYLKIWQAFINHKKLAKKKIEQINRDVGKEFPVWFQEQEKKGYQDKPFSPDYINSCVCEVKRMYFKFAVEEGYLSNEYVPKFQTVRVPKDRAHKRDILTTDQWNRLTAYMRSNRYLKGTRVSLDGKELEMRKHSDHRKNKRLKKEKGYEERVARPITPLEQTKRQIFRCFMLINYSTGNRPGELLKMTWGDVTIYQMDSKEQQKTHRLLKVRAATSKTGMPRTINAPVAIYMERLKKAYESLGMECEPHHFLFRNPTPARREKNTPFGDHTFTQRLENILKWSGIQEELDKQNKKVVLYSARHAYVTWRLEHGVNIHMLCRNIGSSVTYVESTYSHVETAKSTEELTKGIGFIKKLEQQDK